MCLPFKGVEQAILACCFSTMHVSAKGCPNWKQHGCCCFFNGRVVRLEQAWLALAAGGAWGEAGLGFGGETASQAGTSRCGRTEALMSPLVSASESCVRRLRDVSPALYFGYDGAEHFPRGKNLLSSWKAADIRSLNPLPFGCQAGWFFGHLPRETATGRPPSPNALWLLALRKPPQLKDPLIAFRRLTLPRQKQPVGLLLFRFWSGRGGSSLNRRSLFSVLFLGTCLSPLPSVYGLCFECHLVALLLDIFLLSSTA